MKILKIGGNELDQPEFLSELAQVVQRETGPLVIVHGGGRAIADLQARLGIEAKKVDGLRVTDAASLAAAQMVLSGQVNKSIVATLLAAGVDAIGISGVDGGLLRCQKKNHLAADLGFVGEIVQVRSDIIRRLMALQLTVVLSPISLGIDGQIYNVNADEAASALALASGAELLDFVSNVPGVLHEEKVLPSLTMVQTEALIASGVIRDGMVPKVRAAIDAVNRGVPRARIVNLAGLRSAGGTVFYK